MMSKDLISRQAVSDILAKIEAEYPYKVYGDRSSYSQYNEGWADAVAEMDRYLPYIPDAEAEERTAKVIEHDASIIDDRGYKYQRSEYLCGACKKKVIGGDDYCSHCGCRLDWRKDE